MTKLGQFRVKDESPSTGSSLQPGSLFFTRDNATKSSTSVKGKALWLVLSSTKSVFNSCGFKKQRKIITSALVNSCFEIGPKNMEPMMFLSKYFVP